MPVAEFVISEAKSSILFLSHQHPIADAITAAGTYVRQQGCIQDGKTEQGGGRASFYSKPLPGTYRGPNRTALVSNASEDITQ